MRLSCADEMLLLNGCPGVIGLAVVFAGEQPDVEQVRARVAERWTGLERMNCVLDRTPDDAGTRRGGLLGRRGRARWAVPGHFDPAVQVKVSSCKLDDLWAQSVDRPIGGAAPPWRLFVVPDTTHGGGFALALLAQHELLDGRSLVTLMRSLMDTPATPATPTTSATTREPARPAPLTRTGLRAAGKELRAMAATGQALPARTPQETYASVAVCELPAHTVRSARRQPPDGRGATLNELLVGAVAGALRAEYGPVPGCRAARAARLHRRTVRPAYPRQSGRTRQHPHGSPGSVARRGGRPRRTAEGGPGGTGGRPPAGRRPRRRAVSRRGSGSADRAMGDQAHDRQRAALMLRGDHDHRHEVVRRGEHLPGTPTRAHGGTAAAAAPRHRRLRPRTGGGRDHAHRGEQRPPGRRETTGRRGHHGIRDMGSDGGDTVGLSRP